MCLFLFLGLVGCGASGPPPCRVSAEFRPATRDAVDRLWLSGARPKRCRQGKTDNPGELKQFRNYIHIASVGPFVHHFTVWYRSVEPSVCEMQVIENGDKPPLVYIGKCWGGGMAVRPRKTPPPPGSVARLAEAALSAICARSSRSEDYVIAYGGKYRQIELREEVVYNTSPTFGVTSELTLKVNEALTEITDVAGGSSGLGGVCGQRCIEGATLLSHVPTSEKYAGRSLLYPLFQKDERPEYWNALRDEILKAAKSMRDGECGTSLQQLLAAQGDSLLPEGMDPELRVQWMVIARTYPRPGPPTKTLGVPLRARDAVFGVAKGESQMEIGGLVLHASAELRADTEIDPGAVERELRFPMTLRTRVWDERGNSFERTFKMDGWAALDSGRVAFFYGVYPSNTKGKEWEKLQEYQFPAFGDFTSIDLYFQHAEQPR